MTTAAAVRERPILFSGPMVRALLDGRKTQTRRVVKPQPKSEATPVFGPLYLGPDVAHESTSHLVWQDDPQSYFKLPCPFGQPGDLLYVRETWAIKNWSDRELASCGFDDAPTHPTEVYLGTPTRAIHQASYNNMVGDLGRWRPSIHMPKWAARIWLRVTDVRVEQVQEITEGDAWAEGVQIPVSESGGILMRCSPNAAGKAPASYLPLGRCFIGQPPLTKAELAISHYADLWDELNAKRGYGWDANPFVWVVTFEKAEAPRP